MALVSNIYITAIGWYGDVDDEDCPANGKMPSPTVDDPLVLTVHFPSSAVIGEPIEEALADIYHSYIGIQSPDPRCRRGFQALPR